MGARGRAGLPDDDVAGDVGAVGEGDAFGWGFALHARWDLSVLVSVEKNEGKGVCPTAG